MDTSLAGIGTGTEEMGTFWGSLITGDDLKSKAADTLVTNIVTQRASTLVLHSQYPHDDPRPQRAGEMFGAEVGHDTMPWYLYEEALSELRL